MRDFTKGARHALTRQNFWEHSLNIFRKLGLRCQISTTLRVLGQKPHPTSWNLTVEGPHGEEVRAVHSGLSNTSKRGNLIDDTKGDGNSFPCLLWSHVFFCVYTTKSETYWNVYQMMQNEMMNRNICTKLSQIWNSVSPTFWPLNLFIWYVRQITLLVVTGEECMGGGVMERLKWNFSSSQATSPFEKPEYKCTKVRWLDRLVFRLEARGVCGVNMRCRWAHREGEFFWQRPYVHSCTICGSSLY